jgi:hypothetical protein
MKNLVAHLKSITISAFHIISFIFSMYLSVIFFLILMANESVKGKSNPLLKEEFSLMVQKISELPDTLFPQEVKKKEVLSGGLS